MALLPRAQIWQDMGYQNTLKSDEDWEHPHPVPLYILESLRSQLENKYARRRVPYNHLVAVDRMVVAAGGLAKHAAAGVKDE